MAAAPKIQGYSVHPAAAIFPMMDDASLAELAKDIKENGLLEPIWLLDGQIIDGRNRLKACAKARVEPKFQTWKPGPDESVVTWILSKNLMRRHLTSSQRAAIAVQIEPMFAEEARLRALAGARRGGAVTAAKRAGSAAPLFSAAPPATGKRAAGKVPAIDPFAEVTPASESGRSRDQAAKVMGVSTGYVSQAKKIAREQPEVFTRVQAGELTLPQARREIDPDLAKQFMEGIGGIKKKEKPKAPRRKITVRKPRNGKVTSSKVTLSLTVTFGSPKVAADVLQVLDDDPRVLKMDHETVA